MEVYECLSRNFALVDVVHRASNVTHIKHSYTPPKAGFFWFVALLRRLSDAPHRPARRAAPQTKIISVRCFHISQKDSNHIVVNCHHARLAMPVPDPGALSVY